MEAPSRFPLEWPAGWPRTAAHQRAAASFGTTGRNDPAAGSKKPQPLTMAEALARVQQQLDLLHATQPVVSTNVELRLDGFPRSGQPEPTDPGVVVFFVLKGKPTSLPCDRFRRVADNMAAIAAHIDATRRIERYGVGTAAQMYAGFQAIRGPGPKPWRETFGIRPDQKVTRDSILDRYRELARVHHPDAGGSEAAMAELNAAKTAAMQEVGV